MILSANGNLVASSCGWVDKASFMLIDMINHQEKLIKVGDAEYIVLKKGLDDHFAVVQHLKGARVIITIHSFNDPEIKKAEVIVTSERLEFNGDLKLWDLVPKYYVFYLKDEFQKDAYRLVEIDSARKDMLFPALDWFDDSYDHGYQGIMDVIKIPNTSYLLYSIQRDSSPVLYDVVMGKVLRKIKLAGRAGNSMFSFRNKFQELWCIDYDTVVRLNVNDFGVANKKRLQAASLGMMMQFVGDFSFTPNDKYCAIARPFSNDVLLLDSNTLKVSSSFKSKYQPLSLAVNQDYRFVLRDWKSGALEYGLFQLKKKFWSF